MFDVGFSKLLIILAVALIVLGPEKLPAVAGQIGRWLGRARTMARQFRDQLEEEASSLQNVKRSVHSALDPTSSSTASTTSTTVPAATAATAGLAPAVAGASLDSAVVDPYSQAAEARAAEAHASANAALAAGPVGGPGPVPPPASPSLTPTPATVAAPAAMRAPAFAATPDYASAAVTRDASADERGI